MIQSMKQKVNCMHCILIYIFICGNILDRQPTSWSRAWQTTVHHPVGRCFLKWAWWQKCQSVSNNDIDYYVPILSKKITSSKMIQRFCSLCILCAGCTTSLSLLLISSRSKYQNCHHYHNITTITSSGCKIKHVTIYPATILELWAAVIIIIKMTLKILFNTNIPQAWPGKCSNCGS